MVDVQNNRLLDHVPLRAAMNDWKVMTRLTSPIAAVIDRWKTIARRKTMRKYCGKSGKGNVTVIVNEIGPRSP